MTRAVLAVASGSVAVLAGLFLLLTLLVGWPYGLSAVLLTGGGAAVLTGLLVDTDR